MLRSGYIALGDASSDLTGCILLAVYVDRSQRCPCVVASPSAILPGAHELFRTFPFDYTTGPTELLSRDVANHVGIDTSTPTTVDSLHSLLRGLYDLFVQKEAFLLETTVRADNKQQLVVTGARFGFDDAAYRSALRQEDVHRLRAFEDEIPEEVEAEKHGIVYIKLGGDGNIGTLVNGAGLAMNTNDALANLGGKNANFLDTGGKATSETVKTSFQIILKDQRIKAIFVNIFGGLTLCDMIAKGILLAFKELRMSVPVVVRLRGTNEALGQKIIAESGLPLFAFDDFEEAARKVIQLANAHTD